MTLHSAERTQRNQIFAILNFNVFSLLLELANDHSTTAIPRLATGMNPGLAY